MLITRKSALSNEVHTIEIDVTEEQLSEWKRGALIQDAMPNLTTGEREFILTGVTENEWTGLFDK